MGGYEFTLRFNKDELEADDVAFIESLPDDMKLESRAAELFGIGLAAVDYVRRTGIYPDHLPVWHLSTEAQAYLVLLVKEMDHGADG